VLSVLVLNPVESFCALLPVPPIFTISGFQMAAMNGVYVVQWDKPTNGVPTFWQQDGDFMIYWCA
jgi:hypothetical protein